MTPQDGVGGVLGIGWSDDFERTAQRAASHVFLDVPIHGAALSDRSDLRDRDRNRLSPRPIQQCEVTRRQVNCEPHERQIANPCDRPWGAARERHMHEIGDGRIAQRERRRPRATIQRDPTPHRVHVSSDLVSDQHRRSRTRRLLAQHHECAVRLLTAGAVASGDYQTLRNSRVTRERTLIGAGLGNRHHCEVGIEPSPPLSGLRPRLADHRRQRQDECGSAVRPKLGVRKIDEVGRKPGVAVAAAVVSVDKSLQRIRKRLLLGGRRLEGRKRRDPHIVGLGFRVGRRAEGRVHDHERELGVADPSRDILNVIGGSPPRSHRRCALDQLLLRVRRDQLERAR